VASLSREHKRKTKKNKWTEEELNGGNKCGARLPFPKF